MKQSEAIAQFVKNNWADLTPEQINYLGQTEYEVAQLEVELAKTTRAMQAAIDAGVMSLAENEALKASIRRPIEIDAPLTEDDK